jgi:hypothetical protein
MLEWVVHAYHCVSGGSQALVRLSWPTRELTYEHVSPWHIVHRHTYRRVTHLHS